MNVRYRHRGASSALHNFLGAFTSRYSEYHGYWLFGFLVPGPTAVGIDLLSPLDTGPDATEAPDKAARLAVLRFTQQAIKANLRLERIREAKLVLNWLPEKRTKSFAEQLVRTGQQLRCDASLVFDDGIKHYESKVIFVAPHDASLELSSWR